MFFFYIKMFYLFLKTDLQYEVNIITILLAQIQNEVMILMNVIENILINSVMHH